MGISSFFPPYRFYFHFFQSSSCSTYSSFDETARFPSALVQSCPIKCACLLCLSLHFLLFFFTLSLFHFFLYFHCFSSSFTSPLPAPSQNQSAPTMFPTYRCTRVFRVFFLDCLVLENGPDRLFRDVGN